MIQVKVFDEQHEDDLTDSLNEFLAELDEKDVLSVQLATSPPAFRLPASADFIR